MMNTTILTSVILPLVAAISTGLGYLTKFLLDRRKQVIDAGVAQAQIEVDDEARLRKDLIAERKMLLEQLIAERNYFARKVEGLEQRVMDLERQNREKDAKILEQQAKLNENALQLQTQQGLIESLRAEIDTLKQHETDKTTNSAQ